MESNGKYWEAWFRANWYAAITIAVWLVFLGYGDLWLSFDSHYWIDRGLGIAFYSSIPILCGGAVLLFGIGLLVAAAMRKIPVVKGMICGSVSCLAGGGFWYIFVYYVMYS